MVQVTMPVHTVALSPSVSLALISLLSTLATPHVNSLFGILNWSISVPSATGYVVLYVKPSCNEGESEQSGNSNEGSSIVDGLSLDKLVSVALMTHFTGEGIAVNWWCCEDVLTSSSATVHDSPDNNMNGLSSTSDAAKIILIPMLDAMFSRVTSKILNRDEHHNDVNDNTLFLMGIDTRLYQLLQPYYKKEYVSSEYRVWTCVHHDGRSPKLMPSRTHCMSCGGDKNGSYGCYVLDFLRESDVDAVMSGATVDYPRSYIEFLISNETYRNLHRCMRLIPNDSIHSGMDVKDRTVNVDNGSMYARYPAVSWALTHSDFSLGLVSTHPEHTRRGLAQKCVNEVTKAQQVYFRELEKRYVTDGNDNKYCKPAARQRCSYANIEVNNVASMAMMKRVGYVKHEGTCIWTRIRKP
ncbi:hypothetical protein BC832DRAFT_275291 [Gaertneriomyces semiglobifer]|nr:hypothetical protein BC832DRAFT_275291 [Gaertneriomyces semiglobifer]